MTELYQEQIQISDFNEPYLYSVNGDKFSKQQSSELFPRILETTLLEKSHFLIFSGTDSGLLVDYVLNKDIHPDCRILFVEQEHIINMLEPIPEQCSKQIKICPVNEWLDVVNKMQIITYVYKSQVKLIKSFAAQELHDSTYYLINSKLNDELDLHIFRVNAELANQDFALQHLKNAGENVLEAAYLKNTFKDKTCIILAGGPSLDHNLDWVIQNRANLVVFAVSRVSKKLLSLNLTPDFVFAVDPQKENFVNSREMLLFPKTTVLIYANTTYAPIVAQWPHIKMYLGNKVPWNSKFNKDNIDNTPPTVANTALSIAIEMGFKQILLAGVDLCFSKKGNTHASGSAEAQSLCSFFNCIGKQVETYAGDNVETTIQLLVALEALNTQALHANKHNVKIFNLSANAAKSSGIIYRNTDDITLSQSSDNMSKLLKTLSEKNSTDIHIKHCQTIRQEVISLIKECKEIKALAIKALNHNKGIFTQDSIKHKNKMDKVEQTLNRKYAITSLLVKTFGIKYFVQCVQPSDTEAWSDEKIYQTAKTYYQAYVESTNSLIKQLTVLQIRLTNRIEEYTYTIETNKLINYWQECEETGRSTIYMARKEEFSLLKDSEQTSVKAINRTFLEQFNHRTEKEKAQAAHPPFELVKARIELYFRQSNKLGIENLVYALQELQNPLPYLISTYKLGLVYLNILKNDLNKALSIFQEILPRHLSIFDYKQLVGVAAKVGNIELVVKYLELICQHDINYLPQLAKALSVQGNNKDAIEIYSQYLDLNPTDKEAWRSIGKLYHSLEIFEGTQIAFEQVLSIDPNDSEAKIFLNIDH
ncbi:6-hydroxymethylpterin diphosphokinase MptE-like protein [Thalassotalea marina]|uniref:6-hydroxymethylpterin diphosphokinase MptE-like domain-containing protein n=1 Tax=Thalassotalea marina TaxID=1673741 RepID=A0A919BD82_9GAMM|nr:6-hydroxymethylpterin diphosphokinase MptE-like protein [Thalassotalea marina]GHF80311.1 hypothetical protein GCM10017161_04470 [Thalassotalea marina]